MSSSHDITLTPQEQALIMRLKSFRVPEMAHILEEQLKDPNADLNTFMERMASMVDAEWQARADKRFNRLMKEAHLRYPAADLDETIYRPERQLDTQTIERLSTCHWIEEGKNLIVTGSFASGKTYLINAFCVTAMKQSKSVKYIKANTLMSEMEQARIKSTNLDYLNKLTKLDLLVIDDFGLMDLDLDKCRDFFEVLDTRDGRKSTVVISQFPVSTWFDMFADNTYADAYLTRITDKHHTCYESVCGVRGGKIKNNKVYEIDTSKEIQCLFDNNPLMSMTLNNEYQMLPTNNSLITAKFTGMICQCISKYDIQKEKYTDILQIMQKENREQKSKIYTSSQEWYMDNNDELLQAIYELLKSVLQLHKPTNNICDIELLTSRGSLRFEYVYDILSYLESRLNIKINYMTVSRYDMLTVGTLTKFFKESGREYFEKV